MILPAGAVSSHFITFLNKWFCHWNFMSWRHHCTNTSNCFHLHFPFLNPFQATLGEEELEACSCFCFLHILFTENLNISCLVSKAHLIPFKIWANMAHSLNKSSGKSAAFKMGAGRQGNCCASEQRARLQMTWTRNENTPKYKRVFESSWLSSRVSEHQYY